MRRAERDRQELVGLTEKEREEQHLQVERDQQERAQTAENS